MVTASAQDYNILRSFMTDVCIRIIGSSSRSMCELELPITSAQDARFEVIVKDHHSCACVDQWRIARASAKGTCLTKELASMLKDQWVAADHMTESVAQK